ncbi:MAG: hypothetical protein JO136_13275 [Hyphomicrobiales bacterium]|nr:hypothetical protein [Hyphomicrobiales bacterium]
MRAAPNQPTADQDEPLRARATDQERELALLAQFMRHDSVASLADAIAELTGVRGGDLIAEAGLDPSRANK